MSHLILVLLRALVFILRVRHVDTRGLLRQLGLAVVVAADPAAADSGNLLDLVVLDAEGHVGLGKLVLKPHHLHLRQLLHTLLFRQPMYGESQSTLLLCSSRPQRKLPLLARGYGVPGHAGADITRRALPCQLPQPLIRIIL